MEEDEELHDRIEASFCRDHPQNGKDPVDVCQSEGQAVFCFGHHLHDRIELIFLKGRATEEVGMELDCDFMNIV